MKLWPGSSMLAQHLNNGQVLGPKKPLTGWAMEDLAGAYQRHDVKLFSNDVDILVPAYTLQKWVNM